MVRRVAVFERSDGVMDEVDAFVGRALRDWPLDEQLAVQLAVREACRHFLEAEAHAVELRLLRLGGELEIWVGTGPCHRREVLLYRRAA